MAIKKSDMDMVADIVATVVTEALAGLSERLDVVEKAHRIRTGPGRPVSIRKADGTFSWQGTGIVN